MTPPSLGTIFGVRCIYCWVPDASCSRAGVPSLPSSPPGLVTTPAPPRHVYLPLTAPPPLFSLSNRASPRLYLPVPPHIRSLSTIPLPRPAPPRVTEKPISYNSLPSCHTPCHGGVQAPCLIPTPPRATENTPRTSFWPYPGPVPPLLPRATPPPLPRPSTSGPPASPPGRGWAGRVINRASVRHNQVNSGPVILLGCAP